MFPSANYFRDIPCPFFSRAACPRPHCHFKHVQTATQSNLTSNISSSASSINIPPDANETLNKLIAQLSTAAAANSTPATTNSTSAIDLTAIFQNTLLQSLTTALTNAINSTALPPTTTNNDISEKVIQAKSTVATQLNQHQSQSDTIPEYRPTPLAELERRKRVHQQTLQKPVKNDTSSFDTDIYGQATFSPPSLTSSESVEEIKQKVSTNAQSNATNSISKQSSFADDKHSWVTPPIRRKLSSSSDHNDLDERKPQLAKKLATLQQTSAVNKPITKPTATVKPNIIASTKKPTASSTNPMLKRIPKKTTPIASKVRVLDIDLDKVPITPSIKLDDDDDDDDLTTKQITKSTSLKRPVNGTHETPQKKAKVVPLTKPNTLTVKKTLSSSNGITKTAVSDEDNELALFDQVFSSSKKVAPPTSVQQLTSRYSASANNSNDITSTVSTNHTRAETSMDGRRIAHKPKNHPNLSNSSATPTLHPLVDPNSSVNKIPFKTRQEYLTFFFNELKKRSTGTNATSAAAAGTMIIRAQTIEKEIFDKSTSKNSYLNLAAKHLRQLRTEEGTSSTKLESATSKKPNPQRLVVSHSAMLTGGKTDNLGFGIKKQKEVDMKTLTDNELYTFLLVYKATEQDLTDNGYPAFSLDFPDKVLIKNKNPIYSSTVKHQSADPNTRTCCRCGKLYKITNEGEYVKQDDCIYHWGRLRTQRVAGQIDKTYSCCSSKTNSAGCAVSQYHVHDADDTQLLSGYVKTQPLGRQLAPDESYGIFALDCEMCYTINGLELVRVSVVNQKLQSVYETLVKPHTRVLDYNTRWSGINEAQLRSCNVTIEDVQRHLLKLFNNRTILIGHSLESDLKALKIVHETIVDTSLVFPHAKGKPFKRALRTLMAEYLTKIIQENVEGHDSVEDAISCMELMLWKVKQDLKTVASNR
ncbi:unnamed protein product [Adineta ricciae]|uniref:C3H1-type domain-containing protein n=1 Tax=Adineta ricciae TaxID=249248 RepID=A0A815JGA1_ADIRI|nr:unnamed protein product [Adineta ricciae]CAF1378696.1 unnamed protein product [Adineta ricciae]